MNLPSGETMETVYEMTKSALQSPGNQPEGVTVLEPLEKATTVIGEQLVIDTLRTINTADLCSKLGIDTLQTINTADLCSNFQSAIFTHYVFHIPELILMFHFIFSFVL